MKTFYEFIWVKENYYFNINDYSFLRNQIMLAKQKQSDSFLQQNSEEFQDKNVAIWWKKYGRCYDKRGDCLKSLI